MVQFAVLICMTWIGDWTEFRGSKADATATGASTPLVWSDTENVVWKTEILGLGWSSPIVADGVVYLTTAVTNGSEVSLRVLAIDASSGKVSWDREIRKLAGIPAIHSKNSHASPTPIVRDGAIYVHFGAMGTAKLAKDGTVIWTNTELNYPHVHGCGGSPILHDGKLLIVCDGGKNPFVVALDAATGKIVWNRPRSLSQRLVTRSVLRLLPLLMAKPSYLHRGPITLRLTI